MGVLIALGEAVRLVRAVDGRTLAVEEAGDPDGLPVLVHGGTPSSRRLRRRTVADASVRGLRLISYDRPGYGDSSPQPGRVIADAAGDARAICEELGIGRLVTWGVSGGGPHVLACAALLPDLVAAAACLSSLAPRDGEGLDWLSGFDQNALDEVKVMLADESASRAEFETGRAELLGSTAAELAAQWATGSGEDELAALTDEAQSMQRAVAPGIEGSWDDCFAHLQRWGFDLGQISVPVLLLHGERDQAVPVRHGHWLAAHIPGVDARFFPDEGHGLQTAHVGEMHAWLVTHLS